MYKLLVAAAAIVSKDWVGVQGQDLFVPEEFTNEKKIEFLSLIGNIGFEFHDKTEFIKRQHYWKAADDLIHSHDGLDEPYTLKHN